MIKSVLSILAVAILSVLAAFLPVNSLFAAQSNSDIIYSANPPAYQVSNASGFSPSIKFPFCHAFICYPPQFIQTAYNFTSLYSQGYNGSGQTIVIIDAYGSPTIQHDLAVFDAFFGLPPPPSFTIIYPAGKPNTTLSNAPHDVLGWSIETSLDVEYAHAMAPGANIVLAVAPTNAGNTLNLVAAYVVQNYPNAVISESFGAPEAAIRGNNLQIMQAENIYKQAISQNVTVVASAGDSGASNGFPIANPIFPSSSPFVLAVGGTMGQPYPGGLVKISCTPTICTPLGYGGEQVWNEHMFFAASGGAPSLIFNLPSYQKGLGLTSRTTPDVSYDAAVDGGVLVFWSALPSIAGFYIVGGTSAGAPQWAALIAIAKQYAKAHNLPSFGFVNPAIYKLAESPSYKLYFHDITAGNNTLLGSTIGFFAAPGWDDASGWGTPNAGYLVPALAAVAALYAKS